MNDNGNDTKNDDNSRSEADRVASWIRGRLPEAWAGAAPDVTVDRDEILVVVRPAQGGEAPADPDEVDGRISRFREETRGDRMRIADEAERRFGRKVAWGVEMASRRQVFTNLAVPVMTRLRQSQRMVLDTLVDAGVARSRSQALAWCVDLVGKRSEQWLADLRTAMSDVERVRAQGPGGPDGDRTDSAAAG